MGVFLIMHKYYVKRACTYGTFNEALFSQPL